MLLKWIQQQLARASDEVQQPIPDKQPISYFQRLKNTQMLCSECAHKLKAIWHERRCCPQSFCRCDMCQEPKSCVSIFEWSFTKGSLIETLVSAGRIVDFMQYDTPTLTNQLVKNE